LNHQNSRRICICKCIRDTKIIEIIDIISIATDMHTIVPKLVARIPFSTLKRWVRNLLETWKPLPHPPTPQKKEKDEREREREASKA